MANLILCKEQTNLIEIFDDEYVNVNFWFYAQLFKLNYTPIIGKSVYPKNKNTLPLYIKGSNYLTPINYLELKGSSQCKSSVMLAALLAPGETKLMCKPSRNHTELLFTSHPSSTQS